VTHEEPLFPKWVGLLTSTILCAWGGGLAMILFGATRRRSGFAIGASLIAFYLIAFDLLIPALKRYWGKPSKPPGWRLIGLADFLYSKRTLHLVFEPLVAELQYEYFEALKERRIGKCFWVRVRGYFGFWQTVVAQVPLSLWDTVSAIWKVTHPK
jgi:hypothetical protein